MEELWDDYLQYLIWLCKLEKYRKYSRLFEILHNIEFTWIIDRDDNREGDGVILRDNYDIPYDYRSHQSEMFFNRHCSVMEMLVGLSIRVDNEFLGDPAEEHPEKFFMEMIRNLSLDRFTGNRYLEDDVIKIIERWLNRKFDRNGRGSPFPVRRDHRDQRKLEIWDQLNSYINEKFD